MQKSAQFDDRIRNLIKLAQDDTSHGRTLLFSHICDLFLQNRPMQSDRQVRMLSEILNELLSNVSPKIREELASVLANMASPPLLLVKLLSEDDADLGKELLERGLIPEDQLLHLIQHGSDKHRLYISHRFGLSPLVRRNLEQARQLSEGAKLKVSLNQLEEREQENTAPLDEETTEDLLELVRAQNIHPDLAPKPDIPQKEEQPSGIVTENLAENSAENPIENLREGKLVPAPTQDVKDTTISLVEISKALDAQERPPAHSPSVEPSSGKTPPAAMTSTEARLTLQPFPPSDVANDAGDGMIEEEVPQLTLSPLDMDLTREFVKKSQAARDETVKNHDYMRSVADWFWETDRTGNIKFLSEEAFTAFAQRPEHLIGEDFISLCNRPQEDEDEVAFEVLFEKRSTFRDVPFLIRSPQTEQSLWLLSAIAVFDIHSGRFSGFRGSARYPDGKIFPAEKQENTSASPPPPRLNGQNTSGLSEAPNTQDAIAAELLQNMSHEFRTPLNAIIGFSEMIDIEAWGPVNEQYRDHTRSILEAAGQLKEAVNNVLDGAKIESGLITLSPESFSLKGVIQEAIESLTDQARKKDITLTNSDDNIDVILYNDKHMVLQSLTKMLCAILERAPVNAVLNLSVLVNSNARVRIEVPVPGPKIPEKEAENLFFKLKKNGAALPDSQNSDISGPKISSSYGLSLAQDMARLIGGDLTTLSHQGYVSHFVLTVTTHPTHS